jgi:hypothetical protein
MKIFIHTIIQKPWFFPVVLLSLGVVAYGLIMPELGFYWDDWEGVYLYHLGSPSIGFQYYSERPLAALAYLLLFPVTEMNPPTWQVVSLLLRWGGALFIVLPLSICIERANHWAFWKAVGKSVCIET